MRALLLLLISLHPITLLAQGGYEIEGKIDSLKNGDKIYLVYQLEARQIVDSAKVQNGRFLLKGELEYPVFCALYLHKNPYVTQLAAGEKMDYLMFYLEPVHFKVA